MALPSLYHTAGKKEWQLARPGLSRNQRSGTVNQVKPRPIQSTAKPKMVKRKRIIEM
jgi:hypothetical protein